MFPTQNVINNNKFTMRFKHLTGFLDTSKKNIYCKKHR